MRVPLLLAAVWLAGCPKSEFVEPPDNPLDVALFPAVTGGSRLFADVNGARLEFDPTVKDAIVALGQCVDATTYCYKPGEKDLSWCLQHTRTCATQEPWNEKPCCPQECKDEFEKTVAGGVAPSAAIEQVFFKDKKGCFPGVREALEAP